MNKRNWIFFFSLFLCHCTTPPPDQSEKKPTPLPRSQVSYDDSTDNLTPYNDIDILALTNELNMSRPIERIGYQEQSFNTCEVQANRSKSPSCKQLYLGQLNFQAMCRQSTGTVSRVTLTPLHKPRLRWKKGYKRGLTSTNSKGYGNLLFLSNRSSRNGHLYLYLGSKIARKKLQDRWKLILPRSWCNHP